MSQLHPDEVPITENMVRELVAGAFPEWAHLPLERVDSTGTVNVIFRLGEDLCVRLPRRQAWAASLEREATWLPRLAAHLPLDVPQPVAVGDPGCGYPFPWAIYRWIEGETADAGELRDSDAAAGALASFVTALHAIDPAGAPDASRRHSLAMRDSVTREAIAATASEFGEQRLVSAWQASLAAPVWDRAPIWIHGDILPPNVLVADGRVRAVIDFGGAGLGDPAVDTLPAWSMLSAGPRARFRAGLGMTDGTWLRGRGWALSIALIIIPYYRETNPRFVAMAVRIVQEVLADCARER